MAWSIARTAAACKGAAGWRSLVVPAIAAAGADLALVKTVDVLAKAVGALVAAGWRVAVGATVFLLHRIGGTSHGHTAYGFPHQCKVTACRSGVSDDPAGLRTDLGLEVLVSA